MEPGAKAGQEASAPPMRAFDAAVQDALSQLYDVVALQRHSLARWLPPPDAGSGQAVGAALQRALIAAIDAVRAVGPTGVVSPALELRHRALILRTERGWRSPPRVHPS